MKLLIYIIAALPYILFSLDRLPPEQFSDWNVIAENRVWIGWRQYDGFPWCRAKSTFNSPAAEIIAILEDKQNYSNIFKRVESARILTDDIVHISLDMPFPFSSRDYVVSYSQDQDDEDIIYRFHAVDHPDGQLNDGYVRLVNAAGEWRLHPITINSTELSYTWNGELRGDFPDWALVRAWETQGEEVMDWLREALQQ